MREENLVSAFSFFDKDGSGYITIDELQHACKEFGLSDVHLDEMIREIDQNNVGVFSLHFLILPSFLLSFELKRLQASIKSLLRARP